MSINFLHPQLLPEIECSSIASEGFEISNLISENLLLSQKGFLAERFVAGPVIITVKFICPVNIRSILLWPSVGSQRSCGFELQSLKRPSATETSPEYQKIVSGVIKNEVEGIVFHKKGYTQLPPGFHSISFCNRNNENVTSLRIKIFKFYYVAAVKKLQIWGEPGYICDRKTKSNIFRLWRQVINSIEVINSSPEEKLTETVTYFPILNDSIIPEEFYDEITHEVMNLPVILPSGKVIDQQTLEKFQKEEATWGRPPSDPFTGLTFTDSNKPIVNTLLKTKIDEFLLKHADLNPIKSLPRRLGSINEFSRFTSVQIKVSKIVERSNDSNCIPVKRIRYEKNCVKLENTNQDDLDQMLSKTLSQLPSFLNKPKSQENELVSCICCNASEQLYRLPCEHILCRNCSILKKNNCDKCKKSFNFSEIQKIHINKCFNSS